MEGNIKYLTDADFDAEISSGVTLVDFSAEWCGPCKMIVPILEELASTFHGKAKIAKIDIDQNQDATTRFGVTSVPTLILFKDGEEMDRIVGLRTAEDLENLINSVL